MNPSENRENITYYTPRSSAATRLADLRIHGSLTAPGVCMVTVAKASYGMIETKIIIQMFAKRDVVRHAAVV